MDATLTRLSACERIREGVFPLQVGLWRSWERASMAWKRSSVRSRPGPPTLMRVFCRAEPLVHQEQIQNALAHSDGAPETLGLSQGIELCAGGQFDIFNPHSENTSFDRFPLSNKGPLSSPTKRSHLVVVTVSTVEARRIAGVKPCTACADLPC